MLPWLRILDCIATLERSFVDKDDYELLKEEVRRLRLKSAAVKAEVCGICSEDHSTNSCPTMVEDVRMASRFQPPPPTPAPSSPTDDLLKMLLQTNIQTNTHLSQLSQAILLVQEVATTGIQRIEQNMGSLTESFKGTQDTNHTNVSAANLRSGRQLVSKEEKHALEKGESSTNAEEEIGTRRKDAGARRPSEEILEESDSEESAPAEKESAPADREHTEIRHPPNSSAPAFTEINHRLGDRRDEVGDRRQSEAKE